MTQLQIEILKIYQCFDHIKVTPGANDKKKLLKKYADVPLFKEALEFLLNTSITTGLDKKKLKKEIADTIPHTEINSFLELIDYISEHNTGKDEDILTVKTYIKKVGMFADFLTELITKSYRLGVTAKTVNTVFGTEFIPLWQVQQAYPFEKYPLKKGEWFCLSQKLNGFHASFYKGKLISRQGKEITGCQHILDTIEAILEPNDWFIDGELIRKNTDKIPDEENFRLTVSIANSDAKEKPELEFVFYDLIPAKMFEEGCAITFGSRLQAMQVIEENLKGTKYHDIIRHVPIFYEGTQQIEIFKWLEYADKHDMEGLMINRDTPYQRKRNSGILKVKSWKHADLRVIGIEEGEGKYSGTCGKLIVDYKGNPLGLSGMSDEERDAWWQDPDSIIGQIVLVKYKQETKDKTGKKSLQFATYKGVRTDKDEVSYN